MKRSVLIALLGLTSVEGLKINQKDAEKTNTEVQATKKEGSSNASNSTLVQMDDGIALVQQMANLESKQDDFDFQQEMDEADEDADQVVSENGDDDEEEESLASITADVFGPAAAAAEPAPAKAALAAAAPVAADDKLKNKDSSDEECACAPGNTSTSQKASIKAK